MTHFTPPLPKLKLLFLLLGLPLLLTHATSTRANVYATNIKINGSLSKVTIPSGGNAQISYILNEQASGGVVIHILSATNMVRTISIAAGAPGTFRGTNVVVWDGTADNSSQAGQGTYSVTITAAANGYSQWTQISDDNSDGNAVWEGRGIAVDKNTNSPFYGRVFVSNSQANDPGPNNWLGYQVGILKCNADGSYADEGGQSSGGYPWAGDLYSPWHLEVSSTDLVYVNDFTTNGQVIAWDPTISPNSELRVLRPDNWTNLVVSLSGPALADTGTNTALFMADTAGGFGILQFSLLADGTCAPDDTGTTVVALGGSLTSNPVDVALDAAGNIYTIQDIENPGDSNNRVFKFSPYNPNNPLSNSNAVWSIGAGDDTMAGARGIAIDPTGTYVAVAFTGLNTGSNGCTQIFYASNGAPVTNLDLGITISGFNDHEDWDCGWDAVGNVYYIDNIFGVWRTFSPPGTNYTTTAAVPTIEIGGSTGPGVTPVIINISENGGMVTVDFTAGTNDVPTDFSVQAATTVTGQYQDVGAKVTLVSPGTFRATFSAAPGNLVEYFRIARQGTNPPLTAPTFSSINASAGMVVLTFSGSASDLPSSFTLLSSPTINGTYAPTGASISQVSPGLFQAAVPISGPDQFYRILKK